MQGATHAPRATSSIRAAALVSTRSSTSRRTRARAPTSSLLPADSDSGGWWAMKIWIDAKRGGVEV
eukprot:scaffold14798_cov119-Isochrysis_galbana.AAC.1